MDKIIRFAILLSLPTITGCMSTNDDYQFATRARVQGADGKETVSEKRLSWDPKTTALIICDMWDDHWCRGAAARVGELAAPMNRLIQNARSRGTFIIHAPSSTVGHYDGQPQRELAKNAQFHKTPVPLSDKDRWGTKWCWPTERESELPIDDSDMGCDCEKTCEIREAWTKQNDALDIAAGDAITDNGQEVYNLLTERGIDNVIMVGVHLNMCVLGRPFAIRQLRALGKNVILLRDMTDTMYNSRMKPFVNHFAGTDLVVEHVERNWCPTALSSDIMGGDPFKFAEDKR